MENNRPYFVGICGASGSGKTTLGRSIQTALGEQNLSWVSLDNYYRPIEEQIIDPQGVIDFDRIDSLHWDDFIADIHQLKSGQNILREEYTFNNPDVIPKILEIPARSLILVEGILIFHTQELRDLFDLKVFVDVEAHIALKRRIFRDNRERGYDLEDVLYRYEHHFSPIYQQYVLPHKNKADLIVTNDQGFEKALAVLLAFLKTKL